MSILYPVAETAEQAIHAPKAFAAREREAAMLAGRPVAFTTESVGPAFVSEQAAIEAYAGSASAPGEWRTLRPVVERGRAPKARKPVNRDGRRWPEPKPEAKPTRWRLSISYWRIDRAAAATEMADPPARKLRRDPSAEGLGPRALQDLLQQPLRAAGAQQPLDIGLFEVRLPEAPDRTIPDE